MVPDRSRRPAAGADGRCRCTADPI